MTRPTLRAVALFAAGIPLAFGILLADPQAWPYVPAYLFLVCFVMFFFLFPSPFPDTLVRVPLEIIARAQKHQRNKRPFRPMVVAS